MPCLHNGVEDRQAKQELLEGSLVGAAVKEVGAGEGVREVGAQQTRFQSLRGLIRHLDSVFQDGDGEDGGGVAGQPQPEVTVHLYITDMESSNVAHTSNQPDQGTDASVCMHAVLTD